MSGNVPLLPLYAFMVWTGKLCLYLLLCRHYQPCKPLNQGCYCYYYYRCINFSAVEADEVKHCTVVLPQLRYWGPIMTCCTTSYVNEVTWTQLLPACAAVESVTTHIYQHVFKIFSIQQIFNVFYFHPHLVKITLGEELLYYINWKIRLHPVIWRRAECKLVKYVGIQDTQLQTHNLCSHSLGYEHFSLCLRIVNPVFQTNVPAFSPYLNQFFFFFNSS
jgi:hypothetical protein